MYDRWGNNDTGWTEGLGPDEGWNDNEDEVIRKDDGNVSSNKPCCITIVEYASTLGIQATPKKVGFSATTHQDDDGTTPAVDTASGGVVDLY